MYLHKMFIGPLLHWTLLLPLYVQAHCYMPCTKHTLILQNIFFKCRKVNIQSICTLLCTVHSPINEKLKLLWPKTACLVVSYYIPSLNKDAVLPHPSEALSKSLVGIIISLRHYPHHHHYPHRPGNVPFQFYSFRLNLEQWNLARKLN